MNFERMRLRDLLSILSYAAVLASSGALAEEDACGCQERYGVLYNKSMMKCRGSKIVDGQEKGCDPKKLDASLRQALAFCKTNCNPPKAVQVHPGVQNPYIPPVVRPTFSGDRGGTRD